MIFLLAELKLITISGSYAMYPVIEMIKNEFEKTYDVKVNLIAGGSGKGMSDLFANSAQIAMLAREPSIEELKKEIIPVKVYKDAVFIVANAKNPAIEKLVKTPLSKNTLKNIFITGKIKKFSELGCELDKKINVYTRSDSAGSADTLAKFLDAKQEELLGIGVFGDTGIVNVVKKDIYAISYANLPFIDFNNVIILPIEESPAPVKTKEDAIKLINRNYPLSRYCYLVIRKDAKHETKKFIKFVLENARLIEKSGLGVPLSEAELKESLEKIK